MSTGRQPPRSSLCKGGRRPAATARQRTGECQAAEELVRGLLSLDRGPWRRPGRTFVVRMTSPASSLGGELAAERRLREVVPLVEAELAKMTP